MNTPYLTPYQYASCEPIANIDVDGLEAGNATGAASNDYLKSIATEVGGKLFVDATNVTLPEYVAYATRKGNIGAGQFLNQLASRMTPNTAISFRDQYKFYSEITGNSLQNGFNYGFADAAWNTIKFAATVSNPTANPAETAQLAKGIMELANQARALNPAAIPETMGGLITVGYVKDKYAKITSGDPFTVGEAGGGLAFDAGSMALGPEMLLSRPASVIPKVIRPRPCLMCLEEQMAVTGAKGDGIIVNTSYGRRATKTDFLFNNKSEAMNWIRNELGHNTSKIRNASGKVEGWQNALGQKAKWKHGDWYKGPGSSKFPHLNYDFGNIKGHLFLKDKIIRSGMSDSFNKYFGNKFIL
jgi:hypothetical protein